MARKDGAGRTHRGLPISAGRALTPLKDDDSRVVPILEALAPILAAWKLKSGGQGTVFRPFSPRAAAGPDDPPPSSGRTRSMATSPRRSPRSACRRSLGTRQRATRSRPNELPVEARSKSSPRCSATRASPPPSATPFSVQTCSSRPTTRW